MKWPFLWTKDKTDPDAITDAIEAVEKAKAAREVVEDLDKRMDAQLESLDASIKRNHFVDALMPSWTPKEPKHGVAH